MGDRRERGQCCGEWGGGQVINNVRPRQRYDNDIKAHIIRYIYTPAAFIANKLQRRRRFVWCNRDEQSRRRGSGYRAIIYVHYARHLSTHLRIGAIYLYALRSKRRDTRSRVIIESVN